MSHTQIRLRFVAPLRSKSPSREIVGDVNFLPMEAIGEDGSFDTESIRSAAELGSGYTYFEQGDVIRARVTPCFENRKGAYLSQLKTGRGLGTTELFVFHPSERIDPRFLYYVTVSHRFTQEGTATMYGAHGVRRVDNRFARDFKVWLPTVPAQRAIADYLDRETARIDALIEAKRRAVVLSEEKEQRLLLDAVGDWRSAEAWSLRQAGTIVVTGPFGTQLAASEYVQGGVPVINPTHISQLGQLLPDVNVTVSEDVAARLSRHRLRPGDIVLGRKGDVGRSAVVGTEQEGWVCGSDAIAVRTDPGRLDPRYLSMVLHVSLYRQQLEATSTGAMMASLNEGTLLDFRLPVIPLGLQEESVRRMGSATQGLRRLASLQLSSCDLLAERRQALITAAVTGQLEIPEAA